MHSMMKCFMHAAVLGFALFGSQAKAATMWSTVASSCVPDPKSIQGNRYKLVDKSAIGFNGTNIKTVIVNCQVGAQTGMNGPEEITMTFKDGTGGAASVLVDAALIRTERATGVSQQIANVTSGTTAQTGVQQVTDPSLDPAVFDIETYSYFIRVVMKRGKASQDVRFYGLSLTSTCSNGLIGFGEECDDGGAVDGDGCSSTCKVEDGYVCSGVPSICIQ